MVRSKKAGSTEYITKFCSLSTSCNNLKITTEIITDQFLFLRKWKVENRHREVLLGGEGRLVLFSLGEFPPEAGLLEFFAQASVVETADGTSNEFEQARRRHGLGLEMAYTKEAKIQRKSQLHVCEMAKIIKNVDSLD